MRFHLKDQTELDRAADYLAKLAGREATVDIKRVSYSRSNQQNNFYHLMLAYFATQVGCTLDESKQVIRHLQPELYQLRHRQVGDVNITTSRSSADFTKAEMTQSIDRFRLWSAEQGIDIPAPNDTELLKFMDDVIAQNESYL